MGAKQTKKSTQVNTTEKSKESRRLTPYAKSPLQNENKLSIKVSQSEERSTNSKEENSNNQISQSSIRDSWSIDTPHSYLTGIHEEPSPSQTGKVRFDEQLQRIQPRMIPMSEYLSTGL